MSKYVYAAGLLLAAFAQSAVSAAPFQPIVGLPSSYQPGQTVAFEVRLPPLTNLGSYNIDVVLEGSSGAAGVDFFFDVAATVPAASNYVFPSTINYFDSVNVDSAARHRITLTDFDFTGVNVAAGSNDRVATVYFQTLATYEGTLSVFVDAPLLILDTPDVEPTPVPGFDSIQDDIEAAGEIQLPSVPEPSIVNLLLLSCATPAIFRRRRTYV